MELKRKLLSLDGLPPTIILSPDTARETDPLSAQVLDRIAEAVIHRGIRCIVVCGQPDDALSTGASSRRPSGEQSGYRQMLERIRKRSLEQQRMQDSVRGRLRQVRSHSATIAASNKHSIRLIGMFYIPDCDAFLVYDESIDRFVPLAVVGQRGIDARDRP